MKSLRDIIRESVGLSPVEKSKDAVSRQMEMDDNLLEWGYKANQAYVQAHMISKDEARSRWLAPSGTAYEWGFETSQIVPLEWEQTTICRCAWCGRKVFESQAVCSGCGALI